MKLEVGSMDFGLGYSIPSGTLAIGQHSLAVFIELAHTQVYVNQEHMTCCPYPGILTSHNLSCYQTSKETLTLPQPITTCREALVGPSILPPLLQPTHTPRAGYVSACNNLTGVGVFSKERAVGRSGPWPQRPQASNHGCPPTCSRVGTRIHGLC